MIRRARPRTQAAQAAEDLQALARGDTETEDKAAFEFKEIAMQTCVVKYSRKGDFEHVRVANFTFVKIVRTQTWTEPGKNRHAVDVVLVRMATVRYHTDPYDAFEYPISYLSLTDKERVIDEKSVAFVDVEVSIAKANVRNDNDVLPLFQAHYAGLNAHGMTRPMLLSKLSDMPTAEESQRIIVRYGQQDDNVWV